MKINYWFLILTFGILINTSMLSEARAFDFEAAKAKTAQAFEKAKRAIEIANEKRAQREKEKQAQEEKQSQEEKERANANENSQRVTEENIQTIKIRDSRFVLDQVFPVDTKFAFIQLFKEQYKEEIIVSVVNGRLKKIIYLRKGAGNYQVKIYSTNKENKYGDNYAYVNQMNINNQDTRDLSFLLPSDVVQSNDPRIIQIANSLVEGTTDDSEKVKRIHDYVANYVTYDDEGIRTGSYLKDPTDAIKVLETRLTVCAGYSSFFAAIARAANIRTSVVHGEVETVKGPTLHAWNEVFVENEWKTVDVNWDDLETVGYVYFFPTIENFSLDHRKTEVMESF